MSDDNGRTEGSSEPLSEPVEYEIGAVLERARMERGLTLQEVENATKIRKRYLDGLEREDFGVLPDVVYAQGFLKTYANYLGLDGDELSAEFKRRRGRRREQRTGKKADQRAIRRNSSERDFINPGGVSGARRKLITPATLLTVILAIVAIAIVIGVLYYVGRDTQALVIGDTKNAKSASDSPSQKSEANNNDANDSVEPAGDLGEATVAGDSEGTSPPQEKSEAEPADESTSDLTVSLTSTGNTWLSVETDGRTEFAQVVRGGFREEFEARRRVSINTGSAGDILVRVNGQDLGPLGSDGEATVRNFTVKDAS